MLGWIGALVLLVVVVPVVVVLLKGVLDAARRVSAAVEQVEAAAKAASADLDAVELLGTTRTQVNQTVVGSRCQDPAVRGEGERLHDRGRTCQGRPEWLRPGRIGGVPQQH